MQEEYQKKERLTPLQAREKIKHYCAYAERCHADVLSRLYGYGLGKIDAEPIVAMLIEENYLNEERFAIQYAGGHFRMKKWGKVKIMQALKMKNISTYCIKKALRTIDDEEYQKLLQKVALDKWLLLKGQAPAARWAKARLFLLQRGFESHLVLSILQQLQKKASSSKE